MNPSEYPNLLAAEERMWWFRGMRRMLLDFFAAVEARRLAGSLLETGCGTGAVSGLLARRGQWRVFATDLSPVAAGHAARSGLERVAQCDIAALPFRSRSFDALLSLDVIVHLEKGAEAAAFQEFARVLRPDGVAIIRVAALDGLRSRHSAFVGERQRFTRNRFIAGLESAGFKVTRCTYANTFLLPVAWLKFRLWEVLTRQEPASGVLTPPEPLNWALTRILMAEAWLLRKGIDLPLGQTLWAVAVRQ